MGCSGAQSVMNVSRIQIRYELDFSHWLILQIYTLFLASQVAHKHERLPLNRKWFLSIADVIFVYFIISSTVYVKLRAHTFVK